MKLNCFKHLSVFLVTYLNHVLKYGDFVEIFDQIMSIEDLKKALHLSTFWLSIANEKRLEKTLIK